jgi:DNA-binding transcriptional MerR regulator
MSAIEREYRIGELARATKVTVRALHHYDRLGLLVPSSRTAGGHRCYTGADVRRLHAILALRGFGLSLPDIGRALAAGGDDPRELLGRQLAATEERIRQARRVQGRLLAVLGALGRMREPTTAQFVMLIEEMVTMDQPLTPEQLREMQRTRAEQMARLSPDEIAELNRRRAEAMATLSAEEIEEMQRERAKLLPS